MIKITLKFGVLCLLLSFSQAIYGQVDQKTVLVTIETLEKEDNQAQKASKKSNGPSSRIKDFYRHHKKLSVTYDGYAIELTTADFPLNRDYHLFEQFGKVYYDRVEGKGYSYLIIADFSSKKAIEQYLKTVIIHKAPEAKLVEYKKGKRIFK